MKFVDELAESWTRIIDLHQKLDNVKEYTQNIDVLNLEELTVMEQRVEYRLNKIRGAKQKRFENKVLCVICMHREKNVVIQGYNHFVICAECKDALDPKVCPRCQMPFEHISPVKY